MKAYEYDKGFKPESKIEEPDIVWLNVRDVPFTIHGVFYDEAQGQFIRMPQNVADAVESDVKWLNRQTAGGRIKFRTDSKFFAFHAVMYNDDGKHYTKSMDSDFDLLRRNDSLVDTTYCYTFIPPLEMGRTFESLITTDGDMEDYIFVLPSFANVYELYIGVDKNAELLEPTPYTYQKPIVYYGSSITQGGCASRPANTYQSIITKHLDTDYITLGFAGNAKGEQVIAEHIATLDMSIFVLDYDHNAPDAEHLKQTHLPFYRTVRAAHPDSPIVILTAPNTMPWYDWYQARRDVIRETYETAVAEGDKNVYFIDGSTFFGDVDRDLCTLDTCHPTDLGMYRMAMTIEPLIKKLLN